MRILLTTDWFLPEINGVVTSVLGLRRELEREGHSVLILTLSHNRTSHQEGSVIYIASVSIDEIYPGARERLRIDPAWLKKITDWRPDIVHSQCEFSTFGIAKRISRALDIPLVHTYHTIYEDYAHYVIPVRRMGRQAARLLTRKACGSVDWVIAPTRKVEKLLLGYGVATPVSVVPSGLNMERFRRAKASNRGDWGIAPDETLLIYVGRLAKEKNLDEIIRCLCDCRTERLALLIVGDGPHRAALEREAEAAPENIKIRFTGAVPSSQVADYYAMGDLFVCASQSEAQGLTYIEAAASGLPLLCKRDDCLGSVLVSGENGWQYADERDFLAALAAFISADKTRRAALSAASRRIAARYDIRTTVPQILNVYAQAAEARRADGEQKNKAI
ncbi:MAG: glycosyltransferase [Oscillospiraceae bacterium]|nr:glycosyltransferase [Oscillospiraceae bacterium]